MQPGQGRNRQQGIAQHMPRHHSPWRQALGPGGAHVVLTLHFEHRSTGQAGIQGDIERGQRQHWQHGVLQAVEQPGRAVQIEAQGLKTVAGQPAELDRKQQHRHQADPEPRRGIQQQHRQ